MFVSKNTFPPHLKRISSFSSLFIRALFNSLKFSLSPLKTCPPKMFLLPILIMIPYAPANSFGSFFFLSQHPLNLRIYPPPPPHFLKKNVSAAPQKKDSPHKSLVLLFPLFHILSAIQLFNCFASKTFSTHPAKPS